MVPIPIKIDDLGVFPLFLVQHPYSCCPNLLIACINPSPRPKQSHTLGFQRISSRCFGVKSLVFQKSMFWWHVRRTMFWCFEIHPRKLIWNPKMEQNGGLEDYFPFQLGDFQVPCWFSRVYETSHENPLSCVHHCTLCVSSRFSPNSFAIWPMKILNIFWWLIIAPTFGVQWVSTTFLPGKTWKEGKSLLAMTFSRDTLLRMNLGRTKQGLTVQYRDFWKTLFIYSI